MSNTEIRFAQCPLNSFYWCEQVQCAENGAKPPGCAADHFATLPERERRALAADILARRYRVQGVEADVVRLNLGSHLMYKEDDFLGPKKDRFGRLVYKEPGNVSTVFQTFVRDELGLAANHLPIIVPNSVPHVRMDYDPLAVVRGSGFVNDECDMARLIAKAYADEDNASLAGTAVHDLKFGQPFQDYVHNLLLQEVGIPPVSRSEYCEVEVAAEQDFLGEKIPLRGRIDTVLDVGSGFGLGIFDAKRSGVPKNSYLRQMAFYAWLLNSEVFNSAYKNFFLINILHARPEAPPSLTNPTYSITMARSDGPLVREILQEIPATFRAQQELRTNLSLFLEYKGRMETMKSKRGGTVCQQCYPLVRSRCDALREKGILVEQDPQALAALTRPE